MNLWKSIDFSESMKTYEYTKYAKYQIYQTIESEDFRNMDSKIIFQFISDRMEIVTFHEYLKRFIYQKSGMLEPMEEITEKNYLDILVNSYMENAAPYSFTETKVRMRKALQKWLRADSVRRSAIFSLGFGLHMRDTEVDEFLTKVNKEESFDFANPEETVYWFCYHNGFRYSKAKELLDYYDQLEVGNHENKSLWDAMKHDPKMYVHSEKELKVYLKYLKTFLEGENASKKEFLSLYGRVQDLILEIYRDTGGDGDEERFSSGKDIRPNMIEKIFYAEVPLSGQNLEKMSASLLARQFRNKRMNRQHISGILSGKEKPDRFDFITLLFFLYAHNVYYDDSEEDKVARFRDYMDEVNGVLARCNMAGIYPVNPYEAFILMCLVTDDPLGAYYDVWGLSYGKNIEGA